MIIHGGFKAISLIVSKIRSLGHGPPHLSLELGWGLMPPWGGGEEVKDMTEVEGFGLPYGMELKRLNYYVKPIGCCW